MWMQGWRSNVPLLGDVYHSAAWHTRLKFT
jgi:hypothetical protein